MSSAIDEGKSNSKYTIVEAVDIEKDKKNIKAEGFERAYARFLKALPHIVETQRKLFNFYGFFRINRLGCICEAYVAKKIRWKEMGHRLRVVFCLKGFNIQIVEIYFKGDKDVEDRDRVRALCCNLGT